MADESQTQTQPQTNKLISDIFGDSDEENEPTPASDAKPSAVSAMKFDDSDDDDIFGGADSDDEVSKKNKPTKRAEDLVDSDEEEVQPKRGAVRRMKKGKAPVAPKVSGGKLKKRKLAEKSRAESGDEYDSGEEVKANKQDRDFIAGDDDFADIVQEYDEDNTDFRDERPDDEDDDYRGKNKKKKTMQADASHLSSGINLKDSDPLSQTLAAMKQPKAKGQTDAEKDILVDKLQKQMAKAVQMDNELYAQQQPATHKMALLSTVVTTLSMKPLHQTLLDKDILCSLRDWIEPRDAHTLPALSVRTAVYELLMQLPCLPDHLKRTNGEKPPIGVIIVALRKHKMETPANKRLLKELMDKWSRPIFSKSADVRVGGGTAGVAALPTADHPELQEAILRRYKSELAKARAEERAHSADASGVGGHGAGNIGAATGPSRGFGSVMSGQADTAPGEGEEGAAPVKKAADMYGRARTPYNTGFLFTVQPELKNIDKRNVMERTLGEGRMKLFKKMSEGTAAGKGLGKKSNPRAMDMSVSTGPKH